DLDCRGGLLAGAVSAKWVKGTGGPAGDEAYNLVLAHSLRADGFDASEDGTGRGTPLVTEDVLAFGGNNQSGPIDLATACNAKGGTGRSDFESETFVTAFAELADPVAANQAWTYTREGTGNFRLSNVAIALRGREGG